MQDELEKSGLSEKEQEAFDSGILSTAASLSTESESGVHTPLSDKDFETAFSAATHGGAWATGDDYVAAHASSFEAMKGRPLSDEEIADISSDGGRFRDSSSHGRDPFADADDKSTFGKLSPYAQSTAGSDTDSDISYGEDGYRSSRYGRDPLTAPEKFTFAPPAAADDKETKI